MGITELVILTLTLRESFMKKQPAFIVILLLLAVFFTLSVTAFATEGPLDVYKGGENGSASYRLPVLLLTKHGTLVAFADARTLNAGDTGNKINTVVRRSTDGGQTWGPIKTLATDDRKKSKIGNCSAIYDSTTDTIWLLYLVDLKRAYLLKSTDDGKTFSGPVEITSAFKEFDFPWKYFATGHVHGIRMTGEKFKGRFVFPVWMSDHDRHHDKLAKFRVGVIYSDDGGKTFHASKEVIDSDSKLNECSVFETSDGSIGINCRAAKGNQLRTTAFSDDREVTWSKPMSHKELTKVVCQASTLRIPDSKDGKSRLLFCAPNGSKWRDRRNLTICTSFDDGRTWPKKQQIVDGSSGYSDIATDGKMLYAIYEIAEDGKFNTIRMVRLPVDD